MGRKFIICLIVVVIAIAWALGRCVYAKTTDNLLNLEAIYENSMNYEDVSEEFVCYKYINTNIDGSYSVGLCLNEGSQRLTSKECVDVYERLK